MAWGEWRTGNNQLFVLRTPDKSNNNELEYKEEIERTTNDNNTYKDAKKLLRKPLYNFVPYFSTWRSLLLYTDTRTQNISPSSLLPSLTLMASTDIFLYLHIESLYRVSQNTDITTFLYTWFCFPLASLLCLLAESFPSCDKILYFTGQIFLFPRYSWEGWHSNNQGLHLSDSGIAKNK